MSHCEPDVIALLALGETEGFDAELEHIATCARCQVERDQLASVARTGRSITVEDAPVAPPDAVWQAITTHLQASPVDELAQRRARRNVVPWIGVAAAAGMIIGGLGTAQLVGTDAAQPTTIVAAALEPLAGESVIGEAKIEQTQQGQVLSVAVPDLPEPDGYYEVWLLTPDVSNMVAIGVLGPQNEGSFPLPPNIDLAEFSVVDISREAFDGDATHSTDSVVRGTLPA